MPRRTLQAAVLAFALGLVISLAWTSTRMGSDRAPARGSPWRIVVSTVVTVAVLVVVFFGIFPKVADYSEAWSSIQQMPAGYVVALVVMTVANAAVYVRPLQAALPGLGYGPGRCLAARWKGPTW